MKKIVIIISIFSFCVRGQSSEKMYVTNLSNFLISKLEKGWEKMKITDLKSDNLYLKKHSYLIELDTQCECKTSENLKSLTGVVFTKTLRKDYWQSIHITLNKFKSRKDAEKAFDNYKVMAKKLKDYDVGQCYNSDFFHHEYWLVDNCLITATGSRISSGEYFPKIKLVDDYIKKHPKMK